MLRLLVVLLGFTAVQMPAYSAVFFSEHVEGSGDNKALEIYNTESLAFDLSAAGCEVRRYANGSASVSDTVSLTGSVPGMGVYVIANPGSDAAVLAAADQLGNLVFNGDDAIELFCNSASVDVIGQIGFDPGSAWDAGGATSTANNTIRRQADICTGDADGSDAFDPSIEWDGFGNNTFDGLSDHTANCGPDTTPPEITSVTPETVGPTSLSSIDFTVVFSEPVNDFDDASDVTVNHSGTSNTDVSFASVNTTTYTVSVNGITGMGSFTVTINPGAVMDGASNENIDMLTSSTVTIVADVTPPDITSITPETTGPTALSEIDFTVVFSEPVSDFDDAADVSVNHSGTSDTGVSFSAINSSQYVVTVMGISGTGTLSLTVLPNAVQDGAGNLNSATLTSADVTIDPNAVIALPDGLLLSEIVVEPATAEFIEIFNGSADTVDLSDVYLTDASFSNGSVFYYQIVQGAGGGGDFGDFHARFPDGATINPGQYQTVALNGSANFQAAYGVLPDYELYEDGAADGVADMREAFAGSINGQGGLSGGQNNGEVAVLYYWDGQTDLVADLDYALWGDGVEAVDKSGIAIDGPDADVNTSTYLNDTATGAQAVIDTSEHSAGMSWQRADFSEGNEILIGGNGISGHDETSEGFRLTWGEGAPTPSAGPGMDVVPPGPSVIINEVNAVDSTDNEFIELFDGGAGNSTLGGLVLVLFDQNDQVYGAIDLDGISTDGSGYAVVGGASVSPDIALPVALDDGAAAVALYIGSDTDFPIGTAVSTDGLLDALVYDSGQGDDAGLLALLEAGQPQINENANANAATESMQRCPNGAGGARRTETYQPVAPTAGLLNSNCPIGDYYANVIATNPTILRSTLHDTIDDHQWFPYTSGSTDTWDILDLADEDPNDDTQILSVYLNASYLKAGGGNANYNREHTWPRSIGLGQTDTPLNNAATDAHNLRLSNIGYNSDRGNKPFGTCDPGVNVNCQERISIFNNGVGGGAGVYPGNSNWVTLQTDGNQGTWEVWVDRRGDVARTMFYMDVRYEGGSHGGTGFAEPDLVLTDDRNQIQTTPGGTAFMGLLSTLLEWHFQDPVDEKEMVRNEMVFTFQGNRNPFVDHPEWVACLFQSDCQQQLPDLVFSNGFESAIR